MIFNYLFRVSEYDPESLKTHERDASISFFSRLTGNLCSNCPVTKSFICVFLRAEVYEQFSGNFGVPYGMNVFTPKKSYFLFVLMIIRSMTRVRPCSKFSWCYTNDQLRSVSDNCLRHGHDTEVVLLQRCIHSKMAVQEVMKVINIKDRTKRRC